jgi:hypothetical protein
MKRSVDVARGTLAATVLALACGGCLGLAVTRSPVLASVLAISPFVVWGCAVALASFGVAGVALAALPWLTIFGGLLPPLVKTFAAAFAALAALATVGLRADGGRTQLCAWLGFSLLALAAAVSLVQAPTGSAFIEAAKYSVFPTMTLAIAAAKRDRWPALSRAALLSSTLAMFAQLVIIAAGLGSIGQTYGPAERIGFASAPHDIAFLGCAVVAGVLASPLGSTRKLLVIAAASIDIVMTGVRTGIVALVLIAIAWMFISRVNVRAIAAVAAAAAAVFISGADKIPLQRIQHSQAVGEFSSVATAGSGRGGIWEAAMQHYVSSGASHIVFGSGLRSVETITQQTLDNSSTAQSDLVSVIVELGLVGILGLLLCWTALAVSVATRLPLVPVVAFALLNGSLEYLSPLVIALTLAAGGSFRLGVAARRPRPSGPSGRESALQL